MLVEGILQVSVDLEDPVIKEHEVMPFCLLAEMSDGSLMNILPIPSGRFAFYYSNCDISILSPSTTSF